MVVVQLIYETNVGRYQLNSNSSIVLYSNFCLSLPTFNQKLAISDLFQTILLLLFTIFTLKLS